MKAKKVYLINKHHLVSLKKLLFKFLPKARGENWAVKLHMGEYGNLNYIRPSIAEGVVSVLKKKGIKPFLFDTTTLYKGSRYTVEDYLVTAKKNGFVKETMGCPIIISNKGVSIKSKSLKKVFVAEPIFKAKGIIVLSHFKGHPDAGFGGAIKNLGMGAVTRKTKEDVHGFSQPLIDIEKCTGCGTCVKICPEKAIKIVKGKSKIDYRKCFGCGRCIINCPVKALKQKEASLRELLAEVAHCVLGLFKKNKVFYINILMSISKLCDCFPIGKTDPSEIVCPDIGILVSDDLIAIEKVSLDLVNKKTKGLFQKLHGIDGAEQIREAERLKLGSLNYKLLEI